MIIALTSQQLHMVHDAIDSYRENIVDCIKDGIEVDENRILLKTINKDICPELGMQPRHEEMED